MKTDSSLLLYSTTSLYNYESVHKISPKTMPQEYPTAAPALLGNVSENFSISLPGFSSSGISGEMTFEMSTSHPDAPMWIMSDSIWVSAVILLTLEFLLALFTNILLINTICYSPSLKTPPNVQLVSLNRYTVLNNIATPLKTKSWSPLVTIGQMGLKNESQLFMCS